VVTAQGVRVFKGGAYPFKSSDFMSLAETRNLPIEKRGALAAIDRVVKTPRGRVALANDTTATRTAIVASNAPIAHWTSRRPTDRKWTLRRRAPCYRRP